MLNEHIADSEFTIGFPDHIEYTYYFTEDLDEREIEEFLDWYMSKLRLVDPDVAVTMNKEEDDDLTFINVGFNLPRRSDGSINWTRLRGIAEEIAMWPFSAQRYHYEGP